ncbi:MAG: Disulfide bond formation protein B [Pseudomonadales bacterium]|nr:Disulfide bond formation protein B [Pseudomonadales bacterium]
MLPAWIRSRHLFLLIFLATTAMMGFGYWLQYAEGLEPCPLCMTQRIFLVLLGLTGLVAALHGPGPRGVRVYGALAALLCVAGGSVAARHVWLQSLPPELAPACGPDLAYMFDAFPLTDALRLLLQGDGNCATVDWTLLGLSIPAWTLLAFAGFLLVALWNGLRPRV